MCETEGAEGYGAQMCMRAVRGELAVTPLISVVCGDSHSLAVAAGGELYAWGKAYAGRCGFAETAGMPTDDDVPYQPVPRQVVGGGFSEVRVAAVASGRWHNLALASNGELYAWGAADSGRCGFAHTGDMPRDEDNWPYQPVPRPVGLGRVAAIACGENHSLVVADGELYAWGSLHMGRCGFADTLGLPVDDDNHPYQPVPRRVSGASMDGKRVTHIACGTFHSLAVADAELFAWGSVCAGRCGFASLEGLPIEGVRYQPVPRKVTDGAVRNRRIVMVACSEGHSFAISATGDLCAWGNADAGRCGLPSHGLPLDLSGPFQPVPAKIPEKGFGKVKLVSCGSWHSLAVTLNGSLFAWGAARAGRCGFADTSSLPVDENGPYQPVPREVLDGDLREKKVARVACGSWHSLAVAEDGCLYAWGVALMNRCGFDVEGMPVDDLCPYQPTPLLVVAMPRVKLDTPESRGCGAVCSDLQDLLLDESYADVVFEVAGEELRAHVAILAARCDHFRRMFRSGMSECRVVTSSSHESGTSTPVRRVRIANCGPPTFQNFLLWLYTGTLESDLPAEELASLLRLSDLYRVPDLRAECERQLSLFIAADTVLGLIEVALDAQAQDLEAACLRFVATNVSVMRKHRSFEECSEVEVIRRVARVWAADLEHARERTRPHPPICRSL